MQSADTRPVTSITLPLQSAEESKCAPLTNSFIKTATQPFLPFSESLFSRSQNQEKSCVCNDLGVKYAHLNNEKAPPVAETTDEAVDPNVRVHVKAGTSSIVPHSLGRKQECAMEAREIKGLEIASGSKFTRQGHLWLVPSQHGSKKYAVDLNATPPRCTCPDSEQSGQKCKHIFAAEHAAKLQESGGSVPAPTEPAKRPTYKQEWREYNLAQTREKAYFQTLLYQLCQGLDEPVRKGRGRPSVKMADLIFAACVKVYEGISGRRNQTDL